MAVGVRIRVDGRKKNFSRDESESLIYEAVNEIEDTARSNCPVDTGELQSSIHTESLTSRSGSVVADADHAVYVENGTFRMSARSYMRDAMELIKSKYSGKLVFEYDRGY
jgi:HK97 gp10 family phage protein